MTIIMVTLAFIGAFLVGAWVIKGKACIYLFGHWWIIE